MRPPHVDYLGHADYQCRRRGVHYLAHQHQAQWWVSVVNWHSRPWSEVFVDDDGYRIGGGDTIAEAMAAAGFARRPKGGHAKRRAMLALSARLHPMLPGKTRIPLAYRQRPRKGVRLGKRRRDDAEFDARFADAMANALFSNPILSMLQMLGNP
jgi:hypothetical protein